MKQKGMHSAPAGKKHVVAIVLLVVAVVLIGCVYGFYRAKVDKLNYDDGKLDTQGVIDENDSRVKEDSAAMEEALQDVASQSVVLSDNDIMKSDSVFNVLLIGTDERSAEFSDDARGDACMLLSLNKKNMQVTLTSFERGMGVPILDGAYKGQYDWFTHTFRYGGADLMMREVQECFKVDVDYYIRVNFYTFEQIIDAVGGIDVELSALEAKGLNGETYTNATTRQRVSEGLNHLDGFDALQYARIRFIDSDWHRIARQRNVMDKVIGKAKTLSLMEMNQLLDKILPLVQTNLTSREISMLLTQVPRMGQVEVQQMTMPAKGTYGSMTGLNGRKMYAVDFEKNAELLHETIYGVKE